MAHNFARFLSPNKLLTYLLWFVQAFHASGPTKASARLGAAQAAMQAMGPKIEAELERRKAERQEKSEARAAERLKRAAEEGESGKEGEDDVPGKAAEGASSSESRDPVPSDNGDRAPKADRSDDVKVERDGEPIAKGRRADRVLKDIRPGASCVQKVFPGAAAGQFAAQVTVDGRVFEGMGETLSLAKAVASATAASSLFNITFEYTDRKPFSPSFY